MMGNGAGQLAYNCLNFFFLGGGYFFTTFCIPGNYHTCCSFVLSLQCCSVTIFAVSQISNSVRLCCIALYMYGTICLAEYRVIGLTPMVVGLLQSLAQWSGIVSRISSGTRQSALTLSDVCWSRICLRDTSAFSSLEVANFMRYINLLTYLQFVVFEFRMICIMKQWTVDFCIVLACRITWYSNAQVAHTITASPLHTVLGVQELTGS